MKPRIKTLIISAGVVRLALIVLGTLAGWLVFDPASPVNRESSISITREWARLGPLPQKAVKLRIATQGSMFTREFIIEFEAPNADKGLSP